VSVTSTPLHDASVCLSCGAPATARGLDHSHIIPRSQAPDRVDDPTNQVLQCRPCHDLIGKKKARHSLRDHKKRGLWYVYERWNEEACDFLERSVRVKVDKKRGHLVSTAAAEGNIQAPRAVDTNIPSAAALSGEEGEAGGRTKPSLITTLDSKGSASLLPTSPVSAGAEVGMPVAIRGASPKATRLGRAIGAGSSAPALTPLAEDWSALSDDDLQAKYDAAEQMQGMAYLLKCKAVHAYRQNHVQMWGESWTEQAIERFNVSRRTLEVYANLWGICVSRDAYFEQVSPLTDSRSLLRYIGLKKPEDGAVAMEAAVAHYAEYAEPPTVMALAHKLGEDGDRPEPMLTCPECGHSAARSEFR